MKIKFFTILILCAFSSSLWAEKLKLLVLPLSDGRSYVFSVDVKESCSFQGVTQISTTDLKVGRKHNWFIEHINLLQNEINLEIAEKTITPDRILLSLNIAKNMQFEFYFDQSDCTLKKLVHFDEKIYEMEDIYIEYSSTFFSPVIKKILIVNNGMDTNLLLYPWALHGIVSTYEFNAGPALNVHSNIRVDNTNTFEKNNPVIEPIPAFFFRYGPLFLSKDGLGSLVYHSGELSLLGMGILEGEPYKKEGLKEREKNLYLGGILKYNLFELVFYKDFVKDKGYNIKAIFAPEFYTSIDWKLTPQFFVQYWDQKYVETYFGVTPVESVNSGMRVFKGKPAINVGGMIEAVHYVDNWTFVLDLGLKSYGKEVHSSPTVSRRNEVRFISSVLYKFF